MKQWPFLLTSLFVMTSSMRAQIPFGAENPGWGWGEAGSISDFRLNSDGSLTVYYVSTGDDDGMKGPAPAGSIRNAPPTSPPLYLSTPEDTPISFSLPSNDPENDPVTYSISAPTGGLLQGEAPDLTWFPEHDFNGKIWFTYGVSDEYSDAVTYSYVMLEVTPVNDPPIASILNLATDQNTAVSISPSFVDPDSSGSYSAIIVGQPAHGSASSAGLEIRYCPETNFAGNDTFSYVISDGESESQPATITVEVRAKKAQALAAQTASLLESSEFRRILFPQ